MKLFFIIFLFIHIDIFGSEVDPHNTNTSNIIDSKDFINDFVNLKLQMAADLANSNLFVSCSQNLLENTLWYYLASGVRFTPVESELDARGDCFSKNLSFNDSIYQDLSAWDTPVFYVFSKIGTVVKIDGDIIGSDKIGHFFQQGYSYHSKVNIKGNSVQDALELGQYQEETYFGKYASTVYSNADLAANFSGMSFWSQLTGKYKNPITNKVEATPYFECRNDQWIVVKKFDITDYLDESWDERVNCNEYINDDVATKVRGRILESTGDIDHCAKLGSDFCKDMKKKYGTNAPYIISKKCF